MNIEEFLTASNKQTANNPDINGAVGEDAVNEAVEAIDNSPEDDIDVQKAVVEELAADKVAQDAELRELRQNMAIKEGQVKAQQAMMTARDSEITALKARVAELERDLLAEKCREIDQQERNPNFLALLDRDVELPDRFPGESRDHVLEVLSEARDAAERDGRVRRAQILEGVLVANEPNGTLAKKRSELVALFEKNSNVINGEVIAELENRKISHKEGETYLLTGEILKRNY